MRKRIHVVRRKDERCDNFCEMDAKIYDKQTRALCTREWKSAAHSPQGKKENTEKRNEKCKVEVGRRRSTRRIKSYCVEHTSAEMATVLRNQTPSLIRLREKFSFVCVKREANDETVLIRLRET